MIGEVVAGRADVAAEDFQVNLQRFSAVDFTHHFLYQPTPILLKQQDSKNIMVLHLQYVRISKNIIIINFNNGVISFVYSNVDFNLIWIL